MELCIIAKNSCKQIQMTYKIFIVIQAVKVQHFFPFPIDSCKKKNEKHIFNFLSLPTFLLKVIIRLGKIGH